MCKRTSELLANMQVCIRSASDYDCTELLAAIEAQGQALRNAMAERNRLLRRKLALLKQLRLELVNQMVNAH